ncbi:MAG: enoyl-CoA hydratase/isomerase family protein [Gracilibacteraceae bacterium]|jgi:2-(1,2-epoxy-1,2-dihydrophenyl)acetyl-CoA isomerase|nr:enoyl-CoA hydratase/isomerase family protein [Gracilibacteraceae bacterium]
MYDKYSVLLVSVENKIATIKFNRPEFGNALALDTVAEMEDVIEKLSGDKAVGAIVLTGNGKLFCAGGDIKGFKKMINDKVDLSKERVVAIGKMIAELRRCPKPVIAMVNGAAAGAGCSIAMACDFRVVTPRSQMAMSFINMGFCGDTGGIFFMERLLGTGLTTDLIMTGRSVRGEEAVRIGLASKLAPEGELESVTYEFAGTLAARPLFAIAEQKKILNTLFYSNLEESAALEAEGMNACSRTKDFAEAVDAFLEKRTPHFIGE